MSKHLEQRVEDLTKKLDQAMTARSVQAESAGSMGRLGWSSDESRLLASFGCRSLPELLQVNTCDARYRHVGDDKKHAVIMLKSTFDTARFMAQIFNHQPKDPEVDDMRFLPPVRGVLDTAWAKNVGLKSMVRAFSSTTAGDGDEWVPTVISASYVEEYELERKLAAAFKEMPMTSSPWELPVQTDVTKARLASENGAMTDVNFGTEKIQFSARKLSDYFILPEEMNEDSAPAILELARRDVAVSQIRAIEDAIINGDTTGTHMDSDTTAADSNRKAWKGLRKLALEASSTVDFAGAAVTEAKLSDMRKLASKFGVNPRELAWCVGPSAYAQFLKLDNVTTLEKFGPQATVLSGALAVYAGIPVVVSEYVREDLNDSGVHDGLTTTKTVVHLVNASRFYVGRRRPIRIRVAQDPNMEYDRWKLVSYQRVDFKGHKQAGSTYASGSTSKERSTILGIDVLA